MLQSQSISEKASVFENPLKNNTGFTDSQSFPDTGALKLAFTIFNGNKERLPLFAVAKSLFSLQLY